jgi:hypothetical protein
MDCMVESGSKREAAPDTVNDNDCISDALAEMLVLIDVLTTLIVEFMFIPVDIADAIFEIVSKSDGAPPTSDITAVVMALARLLPSARIISEIAVPREFSEYSALYNDADIDATPELLA